jgi:hypothetical protein
MHVRVVRFTDVDPEHFKSLVSRIEEGGPPPGVPIASIKVLHDAQQQTAVVLQHFNSAEDMAAAEQAFSQMDPSDTPGTRASIDRCELAFEAKA